MLDQINKNEEVKVQKGFSENLIPCMECSSSVMEPDVPKGGVVIKVQYAGVCYSEGQLRKSGCRPRLPGIRDTSLFPGFEVSGTIHSVCNTLPNCNINLGDRVILYPDEEQNDERYTEFIPVTKVENVLQLPQNVSLAVAAMLPGGALQAYSAVLKAKPHVEKLLEVKPCVNVLIVGAGGLGLWSIRLAQFLMGRNNSAVRIFVADNSIDKLLTAQEHDCFDIIHWCEEDHEQYIIERTLDACRGGVDIVIDFVSSPRTMQRSLRVLNREGLILVGGNTMSDVSINLNALAAKQQSIVGIPKGTLFQLRQLVDALADGKLELPVYSVHKVEEATHVFEELAQCRLTGRAVLKFSHTDTSKVSVVDNNN
ncbi:hypothetical protein ACJMK2_021229 [Sinanodonta woodiana]|uniref:Enoyl reductase (ER) domain-containing protein n=1 Tax=Sinanodonta woodiana TaxID=1069815 RepID=A0ABD3U1M4_SINWO